jgi:hypothetical protein
MDYNTAGLISLVKMKETIPDSGAAYDDATLLQYLDMSLKGFIVPTVESTLEEHFVVTHDTQMGAQPQYSGSNPPVNVDNVIMIPGESTGLRLRDVYMVGTDGSMYNLPRLTPSQAAAQGFGSVNWSMSYNNQTSAIGGFFLQGNQMQIFPYGLASNKIIRISYQRAPNDLCLTTAAGQVVSIVGDVITMDKVLQWYGSSQVSSNLVTHVNAISGALPHDFVQDATVPTTVYTSYAPLNDMPLVNCVGNVITLPAGLGANIQVGDWICPVGQSVFAQNIPKELYPALIQKAASMCIHAAGDAEGYKIAQAEYNELMKLGLLQIAPRVIGKPIKILPTNSAFKASRIRGWGRR